MEHNFNPEMLVIARESKGYTQTQLAKLMRVDQGTVSRVEAGVLTPSDILIEKVSLALEYPPSFFKKRDQVYGFNSSIFFHRKRQGLSERVLRRLHAQMNIASFELTRLLRSTEISSENKFERIELSEYKGRPDFIAQIVRSTWLLPRGPVRGVTRAIENAGGLVINFDFGTHQIDAISAWPPGSPPLFFVNSNAAITGDRLRLTLAHEIAHVVLHTFPTPTMEEEANKFAAEFLMPANEIKPFLYRLNIPKLAELKTHWKVSMAALVYRAFELGTITSVQRKKLMIQLGKAGYRMREPIETDVPIERSTLVNELIDTHLKQLGFTVKELSAFLDLWEAKFREKYMPSSGLRLVG